MNLTSGAKLGPYEIVSPLGAGGMGEVYRARDTRLDRDVAIKVLPDAMTRDADRIARFEREAKVLASLNHPNIGAIHGFETAEARKFLVLEFVEGETLAQRLKAGALPVDEALAVSKQIAEALEAAHEKGIVHRDLKPGNVMIRPDGTVKVLDFGLARAMTDDSTSVAGISDSPTVTTPVRAYSPTIPGVIMGTAGYMSPEQARGKPVDKRSDIFSFGCVLYEMLTGAQPFAGETVTDSLGAILHREPEWSKLPPGTPAAVVRLLRRCLVKDRRERLRDIGDARLELANTNQGGDSSDKISAHSSRPARWIAVGLAVGLVVSFAGFALLRGFWATPIPAPTVASPLIHLSIPMPEIGDAHVIGYADPSLNITPDGRSVVFMATDGIRFEAFKRQLDDSGSTPLQPRRIDTSLVLSPDGRWLAFQDGNKFVKVPLSGGVPTPVCDTPDIVRGGCWLDDGTLVLTRSPEGPLWRVSESGGEPTPLTTLDSTAGEISHRWPEALPGARGVLYVVKTSRMDSLDQADIWAHDLKSGSRKRLVTGGTMPRYVPESSQFGLLIFNREDQLWAARLDLSSLTLMGIPVIVWKDVMMRPESGLAGFAIARQTGTLLYLNADRSIDQSELVWVDSATGLANPLVTGPGLYFSPSIGPSGEIAVGIAAANDYISLVDHRGVIRRLTRGGNLNGPVWSSTGDAIYCQDNQGRVMRIPIDDPERIAPVPGLDHYELITSCSPDGRLMLFERPTKITGRDIWLFPADGSTPPEPLLVTPDDEGEAVFSPDGKRIAYTQNQNGEFQVFVRGFPATGPDVQVSIAGGATPQWSADGREVYFRNNDKVMAVAIPVDGARPEPPRLLFSGSNLIAGSTYARGVQNGRFLMIRPIKKPPTHLDVVLNWTEDVKRKLDAAKP